MAWFNYIIINSKNGKIYIGKTNDIAERWRRHQADARLGCRFYLHRSMKKHGIENFTIELLEEHETEQEALDREIFYIAFFRTNMKRYPDGNGMNLTDGGGGLSGYKHSEETKAKMSDSAKGHAPTRTEFAPLTDETKAKISKSHIGKIMSEETKAKMSKTLKGRIFTEEHKANMSAAQTGEKNHMFGKKHSEETKAKMLASRYKSVILIDINGCETVFESVKACAESLEVNPRRISEVLKGNRNSIHKCKIKYANEN